MMKLDICGRGIIMSTVIRPEISKKNSFYISKERYYELKHFCMQYKDWQKALQSLDTLNFGGSIPEFITSKNYHASPVERICIAREYYRDKIRMIEESAVLADEEIANYILMAVTKNLSCVALINKYNMPCGKDKFYNAYRKFFWHLSQLRH